MSVADAGEVLTLQRAAYATEAQLHGDPFLPALTQSLGDLVREIDGGSGLVATLDGRIVGAIRWSVAEATAHLGRLTVAPDRQGSGIGTRLLRLAEGLSGAQTAELFTGSMSAANIRLYVREGYSEIRREPLHEGVEGIELVYLSKSLA
ncbi:MAG: GNAT family N-acetyltransferase [Microbacterium sp.]